MNYQKMREALERIANLDYVAGDRATTAVRMAAEIASEALASAEQAEPVAWLWHHVEGDSALHFDPVSDEDALYGWSCKPLYATQPAALVVPEEWRQALTGLLKAADDLIADMRQRAIARGEYEEVMRPIPGAMGAHGPHKVATLDCGNSVLFAIDVARDAARALLAAPSPAPEQREKVELTDAVLVPKEPTEAMLDRAVALMLCAKIGGNYSWTQYARDLWATMLAGSCSGISEMRTRPAAHVEETEKSEHDALSDEEMFAAWVSGGGWQADFDSRAMRAVIEAHEAKQSGGEE